MYAPAIKARCALTSIELGDPCVFSRSLPISDAYPGSNFPTDIRCLCTTVEGRTFVQRLDGVTFGRSIHVYVLSIVSHNDCRSADPCVFGHDRSLSIHVYVLSIAADPCVCPVHREPADPCVCLERGCLRKKPPYNFSE